MLQVLLERFRTKFMVTRGACLTLRYLWTMSVRLKWKRCCEFWRYARGFWFLCSKNYIYATFLLNIAQLIGSKFTFRCSDCWNWRNIITSMALVSVIVWNKLFYFLFSIQTWYCIPFYTSHTWQRIFLQSWVRPWVLPAGRLPRDHPGLFCSRSSCPVPRLGCEPWRKRKNRKSQWIFSSWFCCSEKLIFNAYQVIYNAESEPKQRWFLLIISDSELISVEFLQDFNPGEFTQSWQSCTSCLDAEKSWQRWRLFLNHHCKILSRKREF